MDPRPAFHYLAEDDEDEQVSGGLNHLASRNAAGSVDVEEKVTVVVDWEAAEKVMPRSMFPDVTSFTGALASSVTVLTSHVRTLPQSP